jgi:hypothetical protein
MPASIAADAGSALASRRLADDLVFERNAFRGTKGES